MAEVTVTERTKQQGERLRQLRERLGIGKGELIDALSFGSTQTYDLYERGVSVIRLDRAEDWAAAFGLSPIDFTAVILGQRAIEDVAGAHYDMARALRGHVLEADIPGLVAAHKDESVESQRSAVSGYIRMTHRAQRKCTAHIRPA